MATTNNRLEALEAATQAAREEKAQREYYRARDAFTDADIEAIDDMTASDDLLARWWDFCQMPRPAEVEEELNRIIDEYVKDPAKLQDCERFHEIIEKAHKRRQFQTKEKK